MTCGGLAIVAMVFAVGCGRSDLEDELLLDDGGAPNTRIDDAGANGTSSVLDSNANLDADDDASAPDATVEASAPDAPVDASAPDAPVDALPDAPADASVRDASLDASTTDATGGTDDDASDAETCTSDGGFHPWPQDENLYGVWGSATNDVWAVGDDGTIVHYDGCMWSMVPSSAIYQLRAVSGTATSDVWAVGNTGTIVHWNGSAWSIVSSASSEWLWGVWAYSASDAWAVGENNTLLQWNGTAWSQVSKPVQRPDGVPPRGLGDRPVRRMGDVQLFGSGPLRLHVVDACSEQHRGQRRRPVGDGYERRVGRGLVVWNRALERQRLVLVLDQRGRRDHGRVDQRHERRVGHHIRRCPLPLERHGVVGRFNRQHLRGLGRARERRVGRRRDPRALGWRVVDGVVRPAEGRRSGSREVCRLRARAPAWRSKGDDAWSTACSIDENVPTGSRRRTRGRPTMRRSSTRRRSQHGALHEREPPPRPRRAPSQDHARARLAMGEGSSRPHGARARPARRGRPRPRSG